MKLRATKFFVLSFVIALALWPAAAVLAITPQECAEQGISDDVCQSMMVDSSGNTPSDTVFNYQKKYPGYSSCVAETKDQPNCEKAFPSRPPGKAGEYCDDTGDIKCASGFACVNFACTANGTGGSGTGPASPSGYSQCAIHSDCPIGKYCDPGSFTCVERTSASPSPTTGGTGKAFCDTTNFVYENGLCLPKNKFGKNTLAGSDSLPDLVAKILKALLTFAGVIAVVAIVYGGYMYIAAAGNEEQAEKGKAALINSTIGLVIVMLAYALVNILVTLISK